MNNEDTIHQMMDDHIMGQLKGKALSDFENELQSNKEFADAYELHRNTVAGIRAFGNRELKKELKIIHGKVVAPTPKIRNLWVRYAVAASIVLLISLGIWFVLQPQGNGQLFTEFYQPYQTSLNVRGNEQSDNLKEAEDAYLSGDFEKALPKFENILNADGYNSQIHLATGICYLEEGKYNEAINQFNIVVEKDDPYLKDQAIWYTALTNLKCNKINEAKILLEILANNDQADKNKEAKGLLEKLN